MLFRSALPPTCRHEVWDHLGVFQVRHLDVVPSGTLTLHQLKEVTLGTASGERRDDVQDP